METVTGNKHLCEPNLLKNSLEALMEYNEIKLLMVIHSNKTKWHGKATTNSYHTIPGFKIIHISTSYCLSELPG